MKRAHGFEMICFVDRHNIHNTDKHLPHRYYWSLIRWLVCTQALFSIWKGYKWVYSLPLRRKANYVCYFSMSLNLSLGFELSFKKSDFWGFRLFIWKIINIWIHICVKHRKLCHIYEIIAKNAKNGKKGNIRH